MTESIFAKRFREAMEERAMKQVDILRAAQEQNIKLGKSQISQYVSGKSIPRENVGQILAQILHVDINWLYGKDASDHTSAENNTGNETNPIIQTEHNSVTGTVADSDSEGKQQTMREFKKSTKLDNVLYDVEDVRRRSKPYGRERRTCLKTEYWKSGPTIWLPYPG